VITRKRVSVMRVISSSMLQKRSTLASSSGASTLFQHAGPGAGLDQEHREESGPWRVSACSPPESSASDCKRLPGGRA